MDAPTDQSLEDFRWRLIRRKLNEESLKKALKFYRSREIEPLLIKGWAIGREYPAGSPRSWGDIDFCVESSEYSRALSLVGDSELEGCSVDVHRELRHLDKVPFSVVFGRAEIVDIDGIPVRIPCPEDHLRVMVVHWLTDGGAHRERLWDFYHLIESRKGGISWERCFSDAGPIRTEWILRVIALTSRECGLATDCLPFCDDPRFGVPTWMNNALAKEWGEKIPLIPLHRVIAKPSDLLVQIRKRVPPNPLQATVDVEGRMDDGPRWRYQIGSFLKRIPPVFGRVGFSARRILGLKKS